MQIEAVVFVKIDQHIFESLVIFITLLNLILETLDYNDFAKACIEELKLLQDKFQDYYDVDWYDNWFYNQSTGLLTFSTGSQELNFKYLDIGSFSEKTQTWKWS